MFFDLNAVQSTYIDYLVWVRYSARCVGINRLAYIISFANIYSLIEMELEPLYF